MNDGRAYFVVEGAAAVAAVGVAAAHDVDAAADAVDGHSQQSRATIDDGDDDPRDAEPCRSSSRTWARFRSLAVAVRSNRPSADIHRHHRCCRDVDAVAARGDGDDDDDSHRTLEVVTFRHEKNHCC